MEDKDVKPKVCEKCGQDMHGFCFDHSDFCDHCNIACPVCQPDLN